MDQAVVDKLMAMTDDELLKVSFAVPWQYDSAPGTYDADGFEVENTSSYTSGAMNLSLEQLHKLCFNKFFDNPQISSSVRRFMGRISGAGFEITSGIRELHARIKLIENDPRNRLYLFYPKFVGRSVIEGELFICLTVHDDGFIEIDFIDPSTVPADDGILFHPDKALFPLMYRIQNADGIGFRQIPSIFLAHYPELIEVARKLDKYDESELAYSRASNGKFASLGGFKRFIVSWDKGFITTRNTSHLRTTLQWINYYENLKKYEIDHKKASGAYLWVITIDDARMFRMWLALTDEDRAKTGILAKKTPGGTLVLPPGMKMEVKNPQLPKISDSDTDIMDMVTSGLDEPEDMTSGRAKGTFASVKATRGPFSDRVADEFDYFEKFLRRDFWGPIFMLMSKVSDFKLMYKIKEAVDFDDKQEPVFEDVLYRAEELIDISMPISEIADPEPKSRAYLGVKHGSMNDTLGIPNSLLAKKIGLVSGPSGYKRLRLRKATEDEQYPELIPTIDAESWQESTEAEPGRPKPKPGQPTPAKPAAKKKEAPVKPVKK
jgi:hypothetical protein